MRKLFTLWLFLLAIFAAVPLAQAATYVNIPGEYNGWGDNGQQPNDGITKHEGLAIGNGGFKVKVWDGSDHWYSTGGSINLGEWTTLGTASGNMTISGANDGDKFNVSFNVNTKQILVEAVGGSSTSWPDVYLAGYNGSWGTGGIKLTNNGDGTYTYVFTAGTEIKTDKDWKLCYSGSNYIGTITAVYFNGFQEAVDDTTPYVKKHGDNFQFTEHFETAHKTTFTFKAAYSGADKGDILITCDHPEEHETPSGDVYLYGFKNNLWTTDDALKFTETEPGVFELELESIGANYSWKINDTLKDWISLDDVATYVKGVFTDDYSGGYLIWDPADNSNAMFNPERVRLDEPVKMIYNRNKGRLDISLSVIGHIPDEGTDEGVWLMGPITSAGWNASDVNKFTYTGYGNYEFHLSTITANEMKIRVGNDGWKKFSEIKIRVNGRQNNNTYLVSSGNDENYKFVTKEFVVADGAILTFCPSTNTLLVNATRTGFIQPNVTHITLKPNVGEEIHFTQNGDNDDVWELELPSLPFGYRFSFIRYFQGTPEPETPELGEPDWTPLISDHGLPTYLKNDTRNNTYFTTSRLTNVKITYDRSTNKFDFVGTVEVVDDNTSYPATVAVQGYGSDWGDDVAVLDKDYDNHAHYFYRFKDLRFDEPFMLYDYNTDEADNEYGFVDFNNLDAASRGLVVACQPEQIEVNGELMSYTPIKFVKAAGRDFVNLEYNRDTHEISITYLEAERSREYDFGKTLWLHWRDADSPSNAWQTKELLLDKPDDNKNPNGINCLTATIYPDYKKIEFYLTTTETGGDRYGNNQVKLVPNRWRDGFAKEDYNSFNDHDVYDYHPVGNHSHFDKNLEGDQVYHCENIVPGTRYRVIVSPITNNTDADAVPKFSSVGVFAFADESRPWGDTQLRIHGNLKGEWRTVNDANISQSDVILNYDEASNTYYVKFTAGAKDDLKNVGLQGTDGHEFTLTDEVGILWYKSPVEFHVGEWVPNALNVHTTNDNKNFYTRELTPGSEYLFQLRYNDNTMDWEARFVEYEEIEGVYIKGGSIDGIVPMRSADNDFEYVKTFMVNKDGFQISTSDASASDFEYNILGYIGAPKACKLDTEYDYRALKYCAESQETASTWYVQGVTGDATLMITVRVNVDEGTVTISAPTADVRLSNVKAMRATEFDPDEMQRPGSDFTFSEITNVPGKIRHFNKITGDLRIRALGYEEGMDFYITGVKIENKPVITGINPDVAQKSNVINLSLEYLPYLKTGSLYNVELSYKYGYTTSDGQYLKTPERKVKATLAANFQSTFRRPVKIENEMKVLYGKAGDVHTAMIAIDGIDFGAAGDLAPIYRPSREYQLNGTETPADQSLAKENLATYMAYDFFINGTKVQNVFPLYNNTYAYIFNKTAGTANDISSYKNDFLMEANENECWSQCAVNKGHLGVLIHTPYTSEADMKSKLANELTVELTAAYPVVSNQGGEVVVAPAPAPGRRAVVKDATPDKLTAMTPQNVLLARDGNSPEVNALNDIVTGLEAVSVDFSDAEVEYYNLQGVRIAEPEKGQVVIRRQGNEVTKIRF